ncbi:FadR/GntR family transcriptional regulator [Yaniella flava]
MDNNLSEAAGRQEFSDGMRPYGGSLHDINEQLTAAHFQDPVVGSLIDMLRTMSAGERLVSERELANQLGVSRTALRDRIGRLESYGVLERREREGTVFTGLQPERMGEVLIVGLLFSEISVESLVTVRHALEREAAVLAAKDPASHGLEKMRDALEKMHGGDDGSEIFDADIDFHEGLFLASNSSGTIFLSRALRIAMKGTLRFETLATERKKVIALHIDILDAIENRDVNQARNSIDMHFRVLDELLKKEK